MNQIKKLLEMREEKLKQWKKEKENALLKVPEGSLRVCRHGTKMQYYYRNDPKDFNGIYIKEKEIEFAKKLAQKDYDKKVLVSIEKELNAIKRYKESCPEKSCEFIYPNLHEGRKKLVLPIVETDVEFVQKWQSEIYQGKEFYEDTPEFYTQKGERVRSKSELIIADLLGQMGIPYKYEYPVYLHGFGKVYPDFTVLHMKKRKEILWEHLGMMDDSVYIEKAIKKIMAYEKQGIFPGEDLIITYETRKNPINQKNIKNLIEHYLE